LHEVSIATSELALPISFRISITFCPPKLLKLDAAIAIVLIN
jgi:hypothetical protein